MRFIILLSLFFLIPNQTLAELSLESVSKYLPAKENVFVARALVSLIAGTEFHRTYFSGKYADQRTQEMIQEIKQSMGFSSSYIVHAMYLNGQGFKQFGVQNLIATSNTIFIDHKWFDALSQDEQRFLLAHELAHLYNQDARIIALIATSAIALLGYKFYQLACDQETVVDYLGFLGFCSLVIPAYGRYIEQRADANGAKALGTTKGGIACCTRWMCEESSCNESSMMVQFYYDMVATHPSNERRLEALEALQIN